MFDFNIIKTFKKGIEAEEHYIVEFNGVVYLRAVKNGDYFFILTATASEDDNSINSYSNQELLLTTARQVINTFPSMGDYEPVKKTDRGGRLYLEICCCDYISDVHRFAEAFFQAMHHKGAIQANHPLTSQACKQPILNTVR